MGKKKKKERKGNLGNISAVLDDAQKVNIVLKVLLRVLISVEILRAAEELFPLQPLTLSVSMFQGLFHSKVCILAMASWLVVFLSYCLVVWFALTMSVCK